MSCVSDGSFQCVSVTQDQCEDLAKHQYMLSNPTSKNIAKSCESSYPDRYEADYIGRRKMKDWYVEYTWSQWVKKFVSLF